MNDEELKKYNKLWQLRTQWSEHVIHCEELLELTDDPDSSAFESLTDAEKDYIYTKLPVWQALVTCLDNDIAKIKYPNE